MGVTKVFAHFVVEHAIQRPHETALLAINDTHSQSIKESVSWAQISCAVSKTLDHLSGLAVRSGRKNLTGVPIGYLSRNDPREIILSLACQLGGAIEVPMDHRAGKAFIARCWDTMGGIWCSLDELDIPLTNVETADLANSVSRLTRLADRTDVDRPALVLFTTGTSGDPKGVVLSNRNLVGNAAAKLARVPQTTDDVRISLLPFAHAYARTCDLGTWLISGCVIAPTLGFRGWRSFADGVQPSLVNVVPSLANRILQFGIARFDRLRLLGCGGAAMSIKEFRSWQDCGVTVIQGYGLTEAGPVVCSAAPDDTRPGYVGQLVDGWDHRIVDGRLHIRGPHTMLGYWPLEKKNSDSDWLDTGDLVEQDSRTGQFKILGRADAMIVISNGHVVDPISIERTVETISGVDHALLRSHDGKLEIWVDAQPDQSSESIAVSISQVLSDLPEWAVPRRIGRIPVRLESVDEALTIKGTIKRDSVTRLAQAVGRGTMVDVPRRWRLSTGTIS